MTLSVDDFPIYFIAANGFRPFAWQQRLLRYILDNGKWPAMIDAPTGSGKSSVVDIHIFAVALMAAGTGPRVPRRLCAVVGRRALVDNQQQRAERIADLLRSPSDVSLPSEFEADRGRALQILTELRANLLSLARGGPQRPDREPLLVTNLRGGLAPDTSWMDDPRLCAVICATPDMWGSRLLFRGYMSSHQARPRAAGLLAYDSVLVLDEAHLSRQLEHTAKRVSQLAGRHADTLGVLALQVTSTTATQVSTNGDAVGVTASDVADGGPDPLLARRLLRPKPVAVVETGWDGVRGKAPAAHLDLLAGEAEALLAEARSGESDRPHTIGCVVNRVQTAKDLAKKLKARNPDASVQVWVGRMRPYDLEEKRKEHPHLFTVKGDDSVDFLVTTQTVEVGVDIDLAGLVTELASGSAIAQRAGRINRLGEREDGPIVVVAPQEPIKEQLPYGASELGEALIWLRGFDGSESGLAPMSIRDNPPPNAQLSRGLLQRPEEGDVLRWCVTSRHWFAEEDISLWLRDDLAADQASAGVVVRPWLGENRESALELLRAAPIRGEEVFPGRVHEVREVAESWFVDHDTAFLLRADEVTMVGHDERIRSGDVLILHQDFPCSTDGVLDVDGEKPLQVIQPEIVGLRGYLASSDLEALYESDFRQEDVLPLMGPGREAVFPSDALIEILGHIPWLVSRAKSDLARDEEARQLVAPGETPTTLDAHLEAVGSRAGGFARDLGVQGDLADAAELAGHAHDLGKADLRFQERLGREGEDPLLAKGRVSVQASRGRPSSLPTGWRHEQLSVGLWEPVGPHHELVQRLIGTSHGHGFMPFPHVGEDLWGTCTDGDAQKRMDELFLNGGWERLMETTTRRYGPWGAAFLEAILRAADCQVSGEGS